MSETNQDSQQETIKGRRSLLRRHPVAVFLGAFVVVLISAPLDEYIVNGDLLEAVRLTLILLAGLLALREGRQAMSWGVVLVTPALVGKWINHWRPDLFPAWAFITPAMLFVMFLIARLLRFVLRAKKIDSEVLCAGVVVYLLLGLLWGCAYILVAGLIPGAFAFSTGPDSTHSMAGFTALYFSYITLATVGYGDIAPMCGVARMLAMMEAMTGTFYLAVLLARLVSLYSSAVPKPGDRQSEPLPRL